MRRFLPRVPRTTIPIVTAIRCRSFKLPKKNPNAPWTDHDAVSSVADVRRERSSPDFEDFNSQLDSIEDLSPEELEVRINSVIQSYDPAMYAMTLFPSVDVIFLMMRNALLPKVKPEEMIARSFVDPKICLRSPQRVENVLGEYRYKLLTSALQREMDEYVDASPICRLVGKLQLPDVWISLLRCLVSKGLTIKEEREQFPSLVLGLANGNGPASLGLSTEQATRVRQIAALLVAAAMEYGQIFAAEIAIQLLHANDITPSRELQKQLTMVMSRASSRELDWKLRISGVLQQVAPKWIGAYHKKVNRDISAEVEKWAEGLDGDELAMERDLEADVDESRDDDDADEGVDAETKSNGTETFESLFSSDGLQKDKVSDYFSESTHGGGSEFHKVYLSTLKKKIASKKADSVKIEDSVTPRRKPVSRSVQSKPLPPQDPREQQQRRLRDAVGNITI